MGAAGGRRRLRVVLYNSPCLNGWPSPDELPGVSSVVVCTIFLSEAIDDNGACRATHGTFDGTTHLTAPPSTASRSSAPGRAVPPGTQRAAVRVVGRASPSVCKQEPWSCLIVAQLQSSLAPIL